MINAYSQITTYEGSDFQDFLDKMELVDIFIPVFQEYKDISVAKLVVKYIAFCYSVNSEKIIIGDDWGLNKKRIFEGCMFPPNTDSINYYNDLVHLHNEAVVKSARKWIDHQDNNAFAELIMLQDLRFQMMTSSTAPLALVDYDQKMKNAKYVVELNIMIKETEAKLLQNMPSMKSQIKELNNASKIKKATLSIEKMLKESPEVLV